jgi:DNA-binding transcriptional MerR regulator
MSAPKYSKAQLELIEDMAANGFELADIGEYFGLTLVQTRKWASENIEISKAIKSGKERAKMVDLDRQRRDRLDRLANWFIPTDYELKTIEELAALGWSELKIAEQFDCTPAVFANAKKQTPELLQAIERGQAQSEGRRLKSDLKAWKPTPDDLLQIETLAEEGLTLDSIAAEMDLKVQVLHSKREEIPEIDQAYRTGFAKVKAKIERKAADMALRGNERILPLWLKTRDKENWAEAPGKAVASATPTNASGPVLQLPKPGDMDQFNKDSEKFRRDKRITDANAE